MSALYLDQNDMLHTHDAACSLPLIAHAFVVIEEMAAVSFESVSGLHNCDGSRSDVHLSLQL